jgi:hypothetical protein
MAKRIDYARYEALKRAWETMNPEATAAQYQAAMLRIAKLCGV